MINFDYGILYIINFVFALFLGNVRNECSVFYINVTKIPRCLPKSADTIRSVDDETRRQTTAFFIIY